MAKWYFFPLLLWTACAAPSRETRRPSPSAEARNILLDQGRYLSATVAGCAACHSRRDWDEPGAPIITGTQYTGGDIWDDQVEWNGHKLPGRIQPPNLTPDPQTGLGGWSDEQLQAAIRQGIDKQGNPLFVMMPYPYFRSLRDEDLNAILAYLRSLPPIQRTTLPRELRLSPQEMQAEAAVLSQVASLPVSTPVEQGRYLVTVAACEACHTPLKDGRPDESRQMAGGVTAKSPFFNTVSANLTSDRQTGLGKIDQAGFNRAMRQGIGSRGRQLSSLMPWLFYRNLTDNDLSVIWAYLKTLPPVHNDISALQKQVRATP